MWDDARRKTEAVADLMEVIAELANERLLAARPGQEELIIGELQRAKEAQSLNELANKRIHRDQAFSLQLPERNMYRPLIRASGTETVRGEIRALTDAHARVADQ